MPTTFDPFAGQLVPGGAFDKPAPAPAIALESKYDRAAYNNQATIQSLIPKISDVIIHEPRIFESPLEHLIRKFGHPYGVALEQAAFLTGAPNKQDDTGCVPQGTVDMASQLNARNFAHSIDISIYDREINSAVMDEGQAQAYIGAKMRLPAKTMAQLKYRSTVQLLSDVIDGTRSIVSTHASDGSGGSQTYTATVSGYAGKVKDLAHIVKPVAPNTLVSFPSEAAVTDTIKELQGIAADFRMESDQFNKLGIETFCNTKPVLVMETKTLNAMDDTMALSGADKRIPTRSAREYIGTFADIVEIDCFAPLPAGGAATNKRLGGVMFDPSDFLFEDVHYSDMEGQRCALKRMTGYNYKYESTLGIWRGSDSFAFTYKTA